MRVALCYAIFVLHLPEEARARVQLLMTRGAKTKVALFCLQTKATRCQLIISAHQHVSHLNVQSKELKRTWKNFRSHFYFLFEIMNSSWCKWSAQNWSKSVLFGLFGDAGAKFWGSARVREWFSLLPCGTNFLNYFLVARL
jgi:hypothetical protein